MKTFVLKILDNKYGKKLILTVLLALFLLFCFIIYAAFSDLNFKDWIQQPIKDVRVLDIIIISIIAGFINKS